MKIHKSALGSYLLIDPREWIDEKGIGDIARDIQPPVAKVGLQVRLVAFLIEGSLRVGLAAFPLDQETPNEAQLARIHASCSLPNYASFRKADIQRGAVAVKEIAS